MAVLIVTATVVTCLPHRACIGRSKLHIEVAGALRLRCLTRGGLRYCIDLGPLSVTWMIILEQRKVLKHVEEGWCDLAEYAEDKLKLHTPELSEICGCEYS